MCLRRTDNHVGNPSVNHPALWNVSTSQEMATFQGHMGDVIPFAQEKSMRNLILSILSTLALLIHPPNIEEKERGRMKRFCIAQ